MNDSSPRTCSENQNVKRRRCPLARAARGGQCLRSGCDHYASDGSVVCSCCLAEVSRRVVHKHAELRRLKGKGAHEAVEALERRALEELAKIGAKVERRRVSGFRGWQHGGLYR